MKTFIVAVVAFVVGWFLSAEVYGVHKGVERLWLRSAVKAPGRMAIAEIQEDMNAGRYALVQAKIDALMTTWQRFDSGPDLFSGQGIGDIMVTFSKLGTNTVSPAVPQSTHP